MSAALKIPATTTYVVKTDHDAPHIAELARVTLLADSRTLEGETIPGGSAGTVVGIWENGAAYDVEFSEPIAGLVSVRADEVRDTISV